MALAEKLIYLSIKSDLRNSNSLKMKTVAQNKENLTNIYHENGIRISEYSILIKQNQKKIIGMYQ